MLQIAISNPSKLLCPICTAWEKGPQKLIDKYPPQNEMVYFSLNFRLLDMRMKIQKENSIIFRAHESYKMIDDVNLQNFCWVLPSYMEEEVQIFHWVYVFLATLYVDVYIVMSPN